MKKVDLTGQRFGKLVVVKELPRERDEDGNVVRIDGKMPPIKWFCKCDCGNTHIATNASLKGGTQSCGCLSAETREIRRKYIAIAREAAKKALADKKAEREAQLRCPYPDSGCARSKQGMCCWDCDKYEDCEAKGKVCKNSPAKCGVKKNES